MFRRPRTAMILLLWAVGVVLPARSCIAGADAVIPDVIDPVDVSGWVTQLWEPLTTVGGDLNRDGLEDVVVALHRRDAIPGDESVPVGSRGLAIFFLAKNGRYRRVALAEHLLPCVTCLGTLNRDAGGSPFEMDIEGYRLQVSWIGNEDGLVSVRLTIAWDHKQRAFALVRDEIVRVDPRGGGRQRRVRDYVAGRQVTDGVTAPMEVRFVPIEAVAAEDYR